MDIDIDIPAKIDREQLFPLGTRASMYKDNTLIPHPCGMYLQNIAKDPVSRLSAIPYDLADQFGYTKIDFLHLHILDKFPDKTTIKRLVNTPPNWQLLNEPYVVETLFQLANHVDTVLKIRPRSIMELADCIAIIRPGKIELLEPYLAAEDKTSIRQSLYNVGAHDKYSYKKGHAISYAMIVVLQLHLIGHTDAFE